MSWCLLFGHDFREMKTDTAGRTINFLCCSECGKIQTLQETMTAEKVREVQDDASGRRNGDL